MASSKTLNDFFGKVDKINSAPPPTPSSKRGRSSGSDSPSGVTPPQKRAECETEQANCTNGGDDVAIPDNASSWVGALIGMMKKCTSRVDTFFDKLASLEEHSTSQFNELRCDFDTVTAAVTFLAESHDTQLKINADQVKLNNELEGRMKLMEQNQETL